MKHKLQWRNWVKAWAGAFSRYLATYIGVNWEKISIVTIKPFLHDTYINQTYIFIMKFKGPWSLVPESVTQFFTPFYNKECPLAKIWAIF